MRLGINIDHFATIREARKTFEPDPIAAAVIASLAGADGIVCHLREDRRHLQDKDLFRLKETVHNHLNMEMAATEEMVNIALKVKPDMVTIVPEKRTEVTTEGGLDVSSMKDYLEDVIFRLNKNKIIVSLFIDPDIDQLKNSHIIGADFVELHTGAYANAKNDNIMTEELENIKTVAMTAEKLGVRVSAGHGLNYYNVKPIAAINAIEELNIGHSIVAKASLIGLERAVKDMIELIRVARA